MTIIGRLPHMEYAGVHRASTLPDLREAPTPMSTPTLSRRMTAMDASFLYFEKPGAALHIGSTSLLDGALSRDDLVQHMRSRIHRVPRYRQRAVFDALNLAHPAWEDDPEFEVDRHIEEVVLPEGAEEADLRAAIADAFAPMLPRDRPLWKMVLIQGFPEGRTAMISLVHHCMVDGVSGVELLQAVTDLQRDAEPAEPEPYTPFPAQDPFERVRDAWTDAMSAAIASGADAMRRWFEPQRQMEEMQTVGRAMMAAAPQLLQPAPSTPFNRAVGEGRCYAVVPMSFAELREIRSVLGGTLNDVVLSILSGGLGAYLRYREQETDGVELRAMIPVNVRSANSKEALGNQVSMMIAPLPIGLTDAVERHRAVTARMGSLKEANQAGGFALMSRLTESVPANLQALAAMWTPATQPLFNVVCTNVPGPQVPLYIVGRRLETLWPLLPLSMGLGLGVALTSYNGALYWGLTGDPELVPDIDETARCIERAFEELKLAAAAAAGEA